MESGHGPGPDPVRFSPAALAAIVVDGFVAGREDALDARARLDLRHRLETALRAAIRDERLTCASICAQRAALWSSTLERGDTPAPLRAEARMRYAEATYLADAIHGRLA